MKVFGKDVDIGTMVSFKTHNQIDTQTYRGTVVGFATYKVAMTYEKLTAIHNSMTPDVASVDLSTQQFLLVETAADKKVRPFAICWMNSATFMITDNAKDRLIVVYAVEGQSLDQILNTIRTLGYDCAIYRGK